MHFFPFTPAEFGHCWRSKSEFWGIAGMMVCFITVGKRAERPVMCLGSLSASILPFTLWSSIYPDLLIAKEGGSGHNKQFYFWQKEFHFSVIFSFVCLEGSKLASVFVWMSVVLFLAVLQLLWCAGLFICTSLHLIVALGSKDQVSLLLLNGDGQLE